MDTGDPRDPNPRDPNTARHPLDVEARLDEPLSRWLWLIKWLLAIPHYVLLAFLWIALAPVTLAAFFAIVVTGRYPRPLFDFVLGVLRWSWRVQYYAYATLGTDRYPPFTLAPVPGYPADLHLPRPDRLSRGLVLVKWWLLALPQYVVVGLLSGAGPWLGRWAGDWWGGGLIGLLVLVAAVLLAVTGRYPRPLYDLVVGLNRWVLRVAVYALLLTDVYPPFRLDLGGTEPAGTPAPRPPAVPGTPGPPWVAGA